MKQFVIVLAFLCAVAVFFTRNSWSNGGGEFGGWIYVVTKCAPILILATCSHFLTPEKSASPSSNTTTALLFSASGDLFLSLRNYSAKFMGLGIVVFFMSHYFYVRGMKISGLEGYWYFGAVPPIVNLTIIGVLTWNRFKNVVEQTLFSVYAIYISYSAWLAFSRWYRKPDAKSAKLVAAGYFLFLISDTLLTLYLFVIRFAYANEYVMATYYAAQLLIFLGNFNSARKIADKS